MGGGVEGSREINEEETVGEFDWGCCGAMLFSWVQAGLLKIGQF